ncbi:MAG: tRNA epoxyqueuosine(34) reductase QueG [Spirochaetota bacterium]
MIPREDHFPHIEPEIGGLLEAEGLQLFGVADVEDEAAANNAAANGTTATARGEYDAWVDAGMHGSMDYLARHAKSKYAPQEVLGGCRSVIIVGCNYYQEPAERAGTTATGRIARYAWGRDYHNALGKRLKRVVRTLRDRYPDDRFRSFVDASPLSERFFAERAGVGYTARNTLTISSAYGSWFFLGEILTTCALEPTPLTEPRHGGCPSGCFRCGAACPTEALYDHHRIDARRCISYLTIEHRGSIPEELRPLMGDWIFGCDLCQEVCPLNVRAKVTSVDDFRAHRAGERIGLAELLAIPDANAYRARFAGTPLLRPGRDAMVRNASIAAANTGAAELVPALQRLAGDASQLVREHARWALGRLAG